MTTKISICSGALLQLGKAPISSFEEPGDHARICANIYPAERDSLLREHLWNCAIRREILAPLSDAPVSGFEKQFQLPGDFLRLIEVGDSQNYYSPVSYKLEGRRILASGTVLPIQYVFRNNNEATWDAKLIELMTARMLWKLAYPITQSTSLREAMRGEYEALARAARSIDAQEDPAQSLSEDYPLIYGRY